MKKLYEEPELEITKFEFNYGLLGESITEPENPLDPGTGENIDDTGDPFEIQG